MWSRDIENIEIAHCNYALTTVVQEIFLRFVDKLETELRKYENHTTLKTVYFHDKIIDLGSIPESFLNYAD